jgi:hypothetical protein
VCVWVCVRAGSFKNWLSRNISIVVQKPEEPREQEPRDLMEPAPAALDLQLGGLCKHHLRDWLLIVVVFVLWLLSFLIHPFQRYVGESSFVTPQLRYPYKSNTIPVQAVPVNQIFLKKYPSFLQLLLLYSNFVFLL